jgi:dGTP triphosphohydrolase
LKRESLKLSLVYPEFAEFFSHKKIENSSVKKILDLICEEIKTDDKSYGSKLIENNLLSEEEKERAVLDYVSGMTDSYAINKFKELYLP